MPKLASALTRDDGKRKRVVTCLFFCDSSAIRGRQEKRGEKRGVEEKEEVEETKEEGNSGPTAWGSLLRTRYVIPVEID